MSVMYVLTEQEKLWLMDKPTASLDRIMNMVHCGEYDFFKNVIITNLTKKYAYKYDKSAKNFTKVDKTILLTPSCPGGSPIWKKYTMKTHKDTVDNFLLSR
jgi:iron only hydrogenase large subunit-like protein